MLSSSANSGSLDVVRFNLTHIRYIIPNNKEEFHFIKIHISLNFRYKNSLAILA